MRHLGGVVAGVEDEQWRCTTARKMAEQVFALVHRDRVGVLAGMHALDVERGGPAVSLEAETGQPVIRPSGNDWLPGRVVRRVVVKAAVRNRLSVAARPDALVEGGDRRTIACRMPLRSASVRAGRSIWWRSGKSGEGDSG